MSAKVVVLPPHKVSIIMVAQNALLGYIHTLWYLGQTTGSYKESSVLCSLAIAVVPMRMKENQYL